MLLDFGHRYASRVGVAGTCICRPVLVCQRKMPRTTGMAAYVRDGCELATQIWMWLLRNAGFYSWLFETEFICVQSVPQPWPGCPSFLLFTDIDAAVQAEDKCASFLFVSDLNGNHQEWLGSTTINRHGVPAFDFATVSGCVQLVVGQTHAVVEHWSPDDWCLWPCTGCFCSTHR